MGIWIWTLRSACGRCIEAHANRRSQTATAYSRTACLAVAGVLQLPGFPPALALCAGRGDEEPIGKGDRGEQRQDAFEQLPTGTHECQTAPSDVYSESAP